MLLLSVPKMYMGNEKLTDTSMQTKIRDTKKIRIEVAYATPEKQSILVLDIDAWISPREAIKLSEIKLEFPEIDLENAKIGIFGKLIADSYQLKEKDRIEIYRPLLADPKEVRRRLAAEGKTMGKRDKHDK